MNLNITMLELTVSDLYDVFKEVKLVLAWRTCSDESECGGVVSGDGVLVLWVSYISVRQLLFHSNLSTILI